MLESRVDRLEAVLLRLAEAQQRTEERLQELLVALARLTVRVDSLEISAAWLKGDALERRYRERAAAYFQRVLRRIQAVSIDELERLTDDAERAGTLSHLEHEDLLLADIVVRGQLRDREADAHLLAEVSSVVDTGDTERAMRRAMLLQRVTGLHVIAAVAGERILPDAERESRIHGLWRVLDGRIPPEE